MGVNGSGGWKGGLLRPSRSPYLSRTPMRKLLIQKKYRPMCEHVAFLPVGSTGSRASTTIAHSPTSHRTRVRTPPGDSQLPASIQVVTADEWKAELFRRNVLDQDGSNPRARFADLRNAL